MIRRRASGWLWRTRPQEQLDIAGSHGTFAFIRCGKLALPLPLAPQTADGPQTAGAPQTADAPQTAGAPQTLDLYWLEGYAGG